MKKKVLRNHQTLVVKQRTSFLCFATCFYSPFTCSVIHYLPINSFVRHVSYLFRNITPFYLPPIIELSIYVFIHYQNYHYKYVHKKKLWVLAHSGSRW